MDVGVIFGKQEKFGIMQILLLNWGTHQINVGIIPLVAIIGREEYALVIKHLSLVLSQGMLLALQTASVLVLLELTL